MTRLHTAAPKKKCQVKHALKRFRERFDLHLTKAQYQDVVADIKHNRAEFLYRRSRRVTIWRVQVKGVPVTAAYDSQRHAVVTVFDSEKEDG